MLHEPKIQFDRLMNYLKICMIYLLNMYFIRFTRIAVLQGVLTITKLGNGNHFESGVKFIFLFFVQLIYSYFVIDTTTRGVTLYNVLRTINLSILGMIST